MHEMVSFGLLFLRSKVIFLMFPLFHMGGRLGGKLFFQIPIILLALPDLSISFVVSSASVSFIYSILSLPER